MGYACPVCEDPQADAGHLANHLAFTALLGDDDHETWLDDHVPGWGEMGEAELADVVVEDVPETEFPQVFEDTVGGLDESTPDSLEERSGMLFEDEGFGDDHADHDHGPAGPARAGGLSADMDPETEAIVEEAQEMTREMLREAADEGGDDADGEEAADADADGEEGDGGADAGADAAGDGDAEAPDGGA